MQEMSITPGFLVLSTYSHTHCPHALAPQQPLACRQVSASLISWVLYKRRTQHVAPRAGFSPSIVLRDPSWLPWASAVRPFILQSSISRPGCTGTLFNRPPIERHLGSFQSGAATNRHSATNICEQMFLFLWDKCPGGQLLNCKAVALLALKKKKSAKLFSRVAAPSCIWASSVWVIYFCSIVASTSCRF